MEVRRLNPSDAAAYVLLRREMLDDSPWAFAASAADDLGLDAAHIGTQLGTPTFALIGAFDAGQLIGATGLHLPRHVKMAHRAHIWGVYVTPSQRGMGTGAALMTLALEVARAWPGVTSAGLSVSIRSPEAQRLYERMGFLAWGREPDALRLDGRAYDEIHMVVDL
jgi:RimJ/RimL family protein N-acetyltransferase